MRRALFLFSGAAIVAAALIVPMPLFAVEPGLALPVPPRVRFEGAPEAPVRGQFLLTSVRLTEPPAVDAVAAWLDDEVDLIPQPAVIPPGVDEEEYVQAQRRLFSESAQVAAAVGLRAAGHRVEILATGVRVEGVIAGGPADGKLRTGDVITAIDGRPVRLASDVAEATGRTDPGGEVRVEFKRGNEQRTARIALREVSQLGRPGLGVAVRTSALDVRLPFPVHVDQGQIGGPSAGLMLALTVYDLADPGDLARGRRIAGTGTIDLAGNVGPVGGVRQKVAAARRAGATMFLVPAVEAGEARDAAGGEILVVPVETFDDALGVLSR